MLQNLQIRYSLDPWQIMTPEQNFTFFIPTNEAWDKVFNYSFKLFYKKFRFKWG